jgi:hypothetical protein
MPARAGSATLQRHIRKNAFQTCNAGRAGAQPYHATYPRMFSRRANAGRAGAQPYHGAHPRMRSRRATPVARERNPIPRRMRKNAFQTRYAGHGERNPTAPHTQECVPDVQRRSRGSATLSRHMRKNVFQRCNGGRRGSATLPRRIPKNAFQTCNAGR